MLSFVSYACVSTCVTALSLVYAYCSRPQFYPCVLFLTTHKLNVVILGNLSFFLLLTLGRALKRLYLGALSRDEVEELVSQSKYAITETCLALTVFREELNLRVLSLFTALLFVKIFHWLATMRVEHLARTANTALWSHVRLCALLLTLCAVDVLALLALLSNLWAAREASVLLLFAFEFTILGVLSVSTACKYALHVVDARLEGRWQGKSLLLFYLELVSDVLRLLLYLAFFMLICTYYGLPLHLIRELAITFYNLRERVVKFVNYRRITVNLNSRFPDATREELEAGDDTCIVCREQMTTAKKLQCGHCFHQACLLRWIERASSCPTCRANISVSANPAAGGTSGSGPSGSGGGGREAPGAPPRALPPLPPHLQAHIEQLRASRDSRGEDGAVGGSRESARAAVSSASVGQRAAHESVAAQHAASITSGFQSASSSITTPSRFSPFPPAHFDGHSSTPQQSPEESFAAAAALHSIPGVLPQAPAVQLFQTPHGYASNAAATAAFHSAALPLYANYAQQQTWQQQAHYAAAMPLALDPAYLAAFTHHTLTLQLHMELLESELRQLRVLWDRQVAVQEMLQQQQQPAAQSVKDERDNSEASASAASTRQRGVSRRDTPQQQQPSTAAQQQQPNLDIKGE